MTSIYMSDTLLFQILQLYIVIEFLKWWLQFFSVIKDQFFSL